jgi:osmotically-inducible protein OsmY
VAITHQKTGARSGNNLAVRLGLAGALGMGALVTGFILTRSGRRLMGDVLAGRSRTPLEGRVLDSFWSDRVLGRRELEVVESGPGRVTVQGTVGNWEELGRATAIAERAKGVKEIEMLVEVDPGLLATRRRARG